MKSLIDKLFMVTMNSLIDKLFMVTMLLVLLNFENEAEATLKCYCTEPNCLAKGTNMCIQENSNFGCYKQFYHIDDPPITMGCVTSNLLCDHPLRPKSIALQDWPYTACCTENYCNKDLAIPDIYTANSSRSMNSPSLPLASESSTHILQHSIAKMVTTNTDSESNDDLQSDTVHPVFLLLIVLVIIFTIVVVISLLVIIKIWLYRRKKITSSHTEQNAYRNSRVVMPVDRQSSAFLPERICWSGWDPNQSKSLLHSNGRPIWQHKRDCLYYDTSESTLNESV